MLSIYSKRFFIWIFIREQIYFMTKFRFFFIIDFRLLLFHNFFKHDYTYQIRTDEYVLDEGVSIISINLLLLLFNVHFQLLIYLLIDLTVVVDLRNTNNELKKSSTIFLWFFLFFFFFPLIYYLNLMNH